MKQWIGRSIIVIGILHTIVGFIGLRSILAVLLNEGIINTVNQQPRAGNGILVSLLRFFGNSIWRFD
jgi:hypothetical protein